MLADEREYYVQLQHMRKTNYWNRFEKKNAS